MHIRYLAVVAALLLTLPATAQKGKLRSGIIAIDGGDHVQGVAILEEGFANLQEGEAKPDLIARGYLKLAVGYVSIYQILGDSLIAMGTKGIEPYRAQKVELPLKAHNALQLAKQYDAGNSQQELYQKYGDQLWRMLFSESITLRDQKKFEEAIHYLDIAEPYIQPPWYNLYLLQGYLALEVPDTFKCIQAFDKSIGAFWADTASIREAGEEGIKQIYSNLLVIINKHNPAPEAIYAHFVSNPQPGSKPFHDELAQTLNGAVPDSTLTYAEASASVSGLGEKLVAAYRAYADNRLYQIAKEAFGKYPSDETVVSQYASILQKPQYKAEGLAFFREQVEKNPGNVNFLTAYAELLTDTDREKAKQYYQKALKVDPSDLYANYNLAVILNNEASELQREYNELENQPSNEQNNKKLEELRKEVRAKIESSVGYALAAHAAAPTQCAPISLLISVYGYLNDEENVNAFIEKRKANGC